MITLVEALNYRSLHYVRRPVKSFHVLVGPNASGKSTFLDVVGFLSNLVSNGLESALSERSQNPEELLFGRQGNQLELAVEACIPDDLRKRTSRPDLDAIRYEVAIGFDQARRGFEFKNESLLLKKTEAPEEHQRSLFPMSPAMTSSLLSNLQARDNKVIINKVPGGNDNFRSETYGASGGGWIPSFKLGPQRSALKNLPTDSIRFPVATWFRDFLTDGIQRFVLDSNAIKRPSPPARVTGFRSDGSNLPWVATRLRQEDPERYSMWISHLRTALDGLEDIMTVERPEDRHCYMVYRYEGGLGVPSWLMSDGALRLTALTLPAYLNGFKGMYLIEEPENGIHPRAVVTAYESLSSVYESQVLLATHSPVLLNNVDMNHVLCFAKDDTGATDIVLGSEHPLLQEWRGTTDLGTLLASGVLG